MLTRCLQDRRRRTRFWNLRAVKTLALPSWHFLTGYKDREEDTYFKFRGLSHALGGKRPPGCTWGGGGWREAGRKEKPWGSVQALFSVPHSPA